GAAWWQSGIALQATLDFMIATGTTNHLPYTNYTIDLQRAPISWWPQGAGDFRAASTDDTGWWALAVLSMYSITGEKWLLDIAVEDESYMSQYWTTECDGGLIWRISDLSYKAAISNELYIELTAALYNLVGDPIYLGKSLRAWQWFEHSGMINRGYLINDGLMHGPDNTCINNNAPTWTYNQGVILGGLIQLYKATDNMEYIQAARIIADAVIASPQLTMNGVFTEPCPASGCINDQKSFKGIFVRYLAKLNVQLPDRPYSTYISHNAASAYSNARLSTNDGCDWYGMSWQGPFSSSSVGSQESAVMLLTAAL
ncbi:glycoside hydrolase, partial [Truncatella angustata]